MNKISLAKTLPGFRETQPATLYGYQRKLNAPVNGYLYLNLIENEDMSVDGIIVSVKDEELALMCIREDGYKAVGVTEQINIPINGEVVAFIAPDKTFPDMQIPKSYLKTCTRDLPEPIQDIWISETVIENEVLDDLQSPVYINAAF